MSKWPEYKKKPYYDALTSFMATTHDMDTGKLLDSAVQPAVTAALAAESTVADAAALGVFDTTGG